MPTMKELEKNYRAKPEEGVPRLRLSSGMPELTLEDLESGYHEKSWEQTLAGQKARTIPETPGFIGTLAGDTTIPTKGQMRRGLVRHGLPIAGDIAATMAFPEKLLASRPVLQVLARAGAAAFGGAGGEAAGQLATGEDLNLGDILEQGASGGAGEVGMSAIAATGKPLLRQTINIASDTLPPLKRAAQRALKGLQEKIKTKTTGRALKFMEDLNVIPKSEAGLGVGKALAKKTDWNETFRPFNDAIDHVALINNNEILLDDTTEYINDLFLKFKNNARTDSDAIKQMVNWMGFSGDPRTVSIMKDILEDGFVGPSDAKYVMARFWKKSFGKTTDKANRWKKGLKSIFLEDIERWSPGAAVARQKADDAYRSMQQFLRESPASQKMLDKMNFGRSNVRVFEGMPEKVPEIMFGRHQQNLFQNTLRQPDEIYQLRNAIVTETGGEEAWRAASSNWIVDMFNASMSKNPDTGRSFIRPWEIAERIKMAEDQLKAMIPVGEWRRLKKEADFFAKAADQFEKIDVSDGFAMFEAWGILSPRSKKVLGKLMGIAGATTKAGGKSMLHLMTSEGGNPNGPES